MKAFLRALFALVLVVVSIGAVAAYTIVRRGLSTRVEPTRVEELLARSMRRLATPAAVRDTTNPAALTDAVREEGLSHFADHCAVCHANNGSGETEIGRGLYPPAPDMRAASTQALSDGELFSIIENGIRLTGMPAWGTGTPEGEHASWVLVRFIRRLPSVSEDELARMEALNPKTSGEWRAEDEARRFLSGDDVRPPTPAPHQHKGGQQ